MSSANHDYNTPTLAVLDPRGLEVRSVAYYRQTAELTAESRITRQTFNSIGQHVASWDPRLWNISPTPNVATGCGFSGQLLLSDSADAGWTLNLLNQSGGVQFEWDGRGSERETEFDARARPVAVNEQLSGEARLTVERFSYGEPGEDTVTQNQCGQLTRHDDPAGCRMLAAYSLAGAPSVEIRHFLNSLEAPDWPVDTQLRDALLEQGPGFVSSHTNFAPGELRSQLDAGGNLKTFSYTVAGQLKESRLQLAGVDQASHILVSAIQYNASDQIERETAGNGVVTTLTYSAEDNRPVRLSSGVPGMALLQDLHYGYDAVGNVLSVEDKAQPLRHFNNQLINSINRYGYDSLYQVVKAYGRQVISASNGPALPELLPAPLDPNQLMNYTQTFAYDASGNLVSRHHSGAPTLTMVASSNSNRCLPQYDVSPLSGDDIDNGFDACGNQRQLQPGQDMQWDARNQLSRITTVKRSVEPNDYERYVYGKRGERLRKVRFTQAEHRTLRSEVRYLPGIEIHFDNTGGDEYDVISADAGRCCVRVLKWHRSRVSRVSDGQLRFSVTDLLGSSTLELDQNAALLNQEGFFAFGGTAWWAGTSAVETTHKTMRYCGKERDATGLYHYDYRYYAPWTQRWINPDPAGDVDGLNRYVMVANNPLTYFDVDGRGLCPIADAALPDKTDPQKGEVEISYEDPNLADRFKNDSEESKGRYEKVITEMSHMSGDSFIMSIKDDETRFNNEFTPHKWTFKANFRSKDSGFFASDVARYQYSKVSREQGFFGHLPSIIVRENVTNKLTLTKTRDLASGSDDLLATFVTTPNGSTTLKIATFFELEISKVERVVDGEITSFYVHLAPKPGSSMRVTEKVKPTPIAPASPPPYQRGRRNAVFLADFQAS